MTTGSDFPLLFHVQTGSGAHEMGTGYYHFPDSRMTSSSSTEVKNIWRISPLPHTSSWRGVSLSTGTTLPSCL
jgi:hypothetical protein